MCQVNFKNNNRTQLNNSEEIIFHYCNVIKKHPNDVSDDYIQRKTGAQQKVKELG